jgi:hypothetical protein
LKGSGVYKGIGDGISLIPFFQNKKIGYRIINLVSVMAIYEVSKEEKELQKPTLGN